jgi:hypothetical protein
MQTGRKYLTPEEIKFKNKCELCNQDKKTGNLRFQKDKCPKKDCNKKGSHYHDLCIKCCDIVNFKKK